jgi:hypothetical protein
MIQPDELKPSLVQCHYIYRTPLYFAVRENQIQAAQFLLDNTPTRLVWQSTTARWKLHQIALRAAIPLMRYRSR